MSRTASGHRPIGKKGKWNGGDTREELTAALGGPSKVAFIKGYYNESLTPSLVQELGLKPAAYIDLDADLYISTKQALAYMSRRAAAGRAELLANFLGGAVWGVFRENANCGDPPG